MSKIQRQKQGMVVEGYPDMKRLPRAYRHSENKLVFNLITYDDASMFHKDLVEIRKHNVRNVLFF